MRVTEAFQITGRGVGVTLDAPTALPIRKTLHAKVYRSDGTSVAAEASKEYLLRRGQTPAETEAFRLMGLPISDVPVGSEIDIHE